MKIFCFKKSKIGHGGCTQNRILSNHRDRIFENFPRCHIRYTSIHKWPDLTDVQVVLTSTVGRALINNTDCTVALTDSASTDVFLNIF
jgi:hypothetical protein